MVYVVNQIKLYITGEQLPGLSDSFYLSCIANYLHGYCCSITFSS